MLKLFQRATTGRWAGNKTAPGNYPREPLAVSEIIGAPCDRAEYERRHGVKPALVSLTDAVRAVAADPYEPTPPDADWRPAPLPLAKCIISDPKAREEFVMRGAEWHATYSLIVAAAGDDEEASAHLGDAGEFLAQLGGPARPQTAEEIHQWCAARRAGEL